MTPDQIIALLIEHHVEVKPVLCRRDGKVQVDWWHAGVRRLGSDNWHNYVTEEDRARGPTLEAAVQALADKKGWPT